MKKIIITLVAALICFSSFSQEWSTDGDDIVNTNSGDVKIGNSPTSQGRIYFYSSSSNSGLLYSPIENSSSIGRYFLKFDLTDNSSYPFLTNRTPNGKVVIKTGTSFGGAENTHFTIEGGDGNVKSYFENSYLGIGSNNPTSPLTIEGIDNTSLPDLQINSKNSIIKLGVDQGGPHGLIFGDDGSQGLQLFYRSSPNALIVEKANDGSDGSDLFSIDYDTEYGYFKGSVGIGTTDPQSKLAVNGQIRATEVKVLADINVPDYVFEPDYELRTLEETKEYITENKHLPEIPSAAEIGENGIDLGDMNMRLLKKIEELTLYQIELMERIEELEKKVAEK